MKPDLDCVQNPEVAITGKYGFKNSLEEIPCTCKQEAVVAARKILPTADNTPEILVYNNCARSVFAAFIRQCRVTVFSDPVALKEFEVYLEKRWYPVFDDVVTILSYEWAGFYNHLPRRKQLLLDKIDWTDTKALSKYEYHIFCKREKQIIESWLKLPKNRAISAPNEEAKAVLGPVVWALEAIIGDLIPGYAHPDKNWNDYEKLLSEYWRDGFQFVIQGDGSAYDSTQCQKKKSLVEHVLYNKIVDRGKIHHVDPEIFREVATKAKRKLTADVITKEGKIHLASADVNGTVFSGSSDTTFGNTLRMALYQHFIMYKAGYTEDQYHIWAKGDDFAVFVKYVKDNLEATYYKYFSKPTSPPSKSMSKEELYSNYTHGLGMILKYLTIGDFETIDFCSTNVIKDGDKFKIVRQLNRMSPLCHYTVKGKDFTPTEMHYYLLAQADSIDSWGKDMPFFGDYAEAFRYHAHKIQPKHAVSWDGDERVILKSKGGRSADMRYCDLGYDFSYGYRMRQSDTKISNEAVYDFLMRKYNISKVEIDSHATKLKEGMLYSEL
jgi:hypothetical protein